MAVGDCCFHWDNAPVHTTVMVTNWMVARLSRIIKHPLYSLDLAKGDFYQGYKGAGQPNPHQGDHQ
jgi:hypothetical protein